MVVWGQDVALATNKLDRMNYNLIIIIIYNKKKFLKIIIF